MTEFPFAIHEVGPKLWADSEDGAKAVMNEIVFNLNRFRKVVDHLKKLFDPNQSRLEPFTPERLVSIMDINVRQEPQPR